MKANKQQVNIIVMYKLAGRMNELSALVPPSSLVDSYFNPSPWLK